MLVSEESIPVSAVRPSIRGLPQYPRNSRNAIDAWRSLSYGRLHLVLMGISEDEIALRFEGKCGLKRAVVPEPEFYIL